MKSSIQFFTILLFVTTVFIPLFSQTKMGDDIVGEIVDDFSGMSVSLSADGSRVAIGAILNNGNGHDAGHVRVHEWDGEGWIQVGEDIDGEAKFDESGWSVSLSSDGNRVAIGARFNDGNGSDAGQVRVYDWIGGNWTQVGEDIDGEAAGDWSGWSVSLSSNGNRVAIGAIENDLNGSHPGQVRVYDWIGGNWTQVGEDIDGEAAGDESGWSVSLSSDGNRVAIGSRSNDGNGSDAGQVRVYDLIGGNWIQAGEDIDGKAGDKSGSSVSLSSDGSRVAIGAPSNSGNGLFSGQVKVYDLIGGNWIQVGEDIDGEKALDRLGFSVSLSSDGNRVAIGAYGNGNFKGRVQIYEWVGGICQQAGEDIDGESPLEWFGRSVSLSSNGNRVASGAPLSDGYGSSAGKVRVYELSDVTNLTIVEVNEIEIFPNPTSGNIKLNGVEGRTIKIIDSFGRFIFKVENPESEIDISDLPSGIYFIQISSGNLLITKKIIKQ